MTELTTGKRVTRKTPATIQGRAIVITLRTYGCEVRLLGTRKTFTISYDGIYRRGAQIEANKKLAEKMAAKKATRSKSR